MAEKMLVADPECSLWCSTTGAGPVVVVVHGGPGLADYTEAISETLADSHLVVRWDQRGCGESSDTGPYTLEQSIADCLTVLDDVSPNAPVHLMGHSFGADLALHVALTHPDRVHSVTYMSGMGLSNDWQDEWVENRQAKWDRRTIKNVERLSRKKRTVAEEMELLRVLWAPDFAKQLPATSHFKKLTKRWSGINEECNRALNAELEARDEMQLQAACKGLEVPVLVIQGEADPRPVWSLDGLCEALPMVRRVVLPDVSHYAFLEAPDDVTAEVSALVDAGLRRAAHLAQTDD